MTLFREALSLRLQRRFWVLPACLGRKVDLLCCLRGQTLPFPGAVGIHPDFPLGSFSSSGISPPSVFPAGYLQFSSVFHFSPSYWGRSEEEKQGASLALPVLLICLNLLGWICSSRGSPGFWSISLCHCNIIRNPPESQLKQVPSCQRWEENLRCVQRQWVW